MKSIIPFSTPPSELLSLALADLEKCEANEDVFVIDMSGWYTKKYDDVCMVCLAGAVMAQTLKVELNNNEIAYPDQFEHHTSLQLFAIDNLRTGQIFKAFGALKLKHLLFLPMSVRITPYAASRSQFKSDLQNLIALLKKHNH